jgi:hypothetical protein
MGAPQHFCLFQEQFAKLGFSIVIVAGQEDFGRIVQNLLYLVELRLCIQFHTSVLVVSVHPQSSWAHVHIVQSSSTFIENDA